MYASLTPPACQTEVERLHAAATSAEADSNQQALAAHAELLRLAGMLDSHLQTLDAQQLQREQVVVTVWRTVF